MSDKTRQDFEAWANTSYNLKGAAPSRDRDGDYTLPGLQDDWEVWQAAREIPKPKEVDRGKFEKWYNDYHSKPGDFHRKANGTYKDAAIQEKWEFHCLKEGIAPITFALDYDGTYTRDPDLWLEFIRIAQARGHEVLIATMRTFEETQDMCERLTELVHQIVPTSRSAKQPFLAAYGIKPHIWIDDQPHFLLLDAQPIDDGG